MNLNELSPDQLATFLRSTSGPKDYPSPLPDPIFEELDQLREEDCASLVYKFPKAIVHYEGKQWAQYGAINGIFLERIKKYKIDRKVVQAKYKDSERIRTAARATTELYEEISHIIDQPDLPSIRDELIGLQEKIKQLAIYEYAAAKTIDIDAKAVTEKALGLQTDRNVIDRDMAFSAEEVDKIQKKLYEQRITTMATRHGSGNGYRGGRGYGRGKNSTTAAGEIKTSQTDPATTPPALPSSNQFSSNTTSSLFISPRWGPFGWPVETFHSSLGDVRMGNFGGQEWISDFVEPATYTLVDASTRIEPKRVGIFGSSGVSIFGQQVNRGGTHTIRLFLLQEKTKMEGILALREGDYLAKIDLKDAYTVVPIAQNSWPRVPLMIGGFAAVHNHRLPTYWSQRLDPQAAAIDAFR